MRTIIVFLLVCGAVLSSNVVAQGQPLSERQIVLDAMAERPGDPWPRGDGHVLLGEPGSPRNQKAYHEPGGSFSPSPGSFGVSFWVVDKDGKLVTTSDGIKIEKISQRYDWKQDNGIPDIVTKTAYYQVGGRM